MNIGEPREIVEVELDPLNAPAPYTPDSNPETVPHETPAETPELIPA